MSKKVIKVTEGELQNLIKEEFSKLLEDEIKFQNYPVYNEIEESFKQHLFIEFYYRHDKGFLVEQLSTFSTTLINERFGIPNDCEEMTREIMKQIDDSVSTKTIELNNRWVGNIKIIVNNNPHIIASFMPFQSQIYYSVIDDKFYYRYKPLVLTLNYDNTEEELFVAIMHELTHAYEEYNRRIKSKETLIDNGTKYGYNKNKIATDDVNEHILSRILYYTYNVEQNAFVSSMIGELKHTNKTFISIEEVLNFIRNTNTYNKYMAVIGWMNAFIENKDTNLQNKVLKYVKQLSNLKFNTYNQFVKYLKQKKEEITKRFNTIIPKIAYEHLNHGGLMMQDNIMTDNDKNLKVRKK